LILGPIVDFVCTNVKNVQTIIWKKNPSKPKIQNLFYIINLQKSLAGILAICKGHPASTQGKTAKKKLVSTF